MTPSESQHVQEYEHHSNLLKDRIKTIDADIAECHRIMDRRLQILNEKKEELSELVRNDERAIQRIILRQVVV